MQEGKNACGKCSHSEDVEKAGSQKTDITGAVADQVPEVDDQHPGDLSKPPKCVSSGEFKDKEKEL